MLEVWPRRNPAETSMFQWMILGDTAPLKAQVFIPLALGEVNQLGTPPFSPYLHSTDNVSI